MTSHVANDDLDWEELVARGDTLLCPVCNSIVLVARTPDEAKAQQIPPGMQCSRDVRHYQVIFDLAEEP